jgi:PAS domain S-box-containing protein/diguanylate cyclase (GGDEF)-like protein
VKLLIADDHVLNLKLLRTQLELEGHEVVDAADGVEALERLESEPFDGVVSDILMPRMDGYRLCMEVRRRPSLATLPFVLYTSTYNSPGDRLLADSVGADAYISKPAPTARILEALAAAAGRQGVRQPPPAIDEPAPLMRQYNEVLIRKLEEKGEELERTHEGLVESQARLAGLIASAMDAIVVVDEARRIVLFNAAAGHMFAIDPEQAMGRALADFIPEAAHAEHPDLVAGVGAQVELDRRTAAREVMALRADGSEFPVEANISRLLTSHGMLFTVFMRDVTERKRAQAALRESEAGLRRAQEVAQMAHAIVDVDGAFESRSDSLSALLGLAPEALPRTVDEWIALAHPEDRDGVLAASAEMRRTGRRQDVEYRMRHGQEWRRLRHIVEPLHEGLNDHRRRSFNTIQDVTAERQAQDKIHQLNRVYAVLGAINGLIVRANDRGELLEQACRILVDTGRLSKAWIGLVDEGIAPVRVMAWAGIDEEFFAGLQQRLSRIAGASESVLHTALSGAGTVVCNDVANDPRVLERDRIVASGSLSLALFPLQVGERVVGVISIHAPIVGFFDAEETSLLQRLADDVAFALDHLMKADRLHYLANHDVLTGLPNRLLFSELLTQSLPDAAVSAGLGCVALLDLVRFRRVNETLGRRAGDDLLVQVAARLRGVDPFVARVGPDLYALQFNERRSAAELAREFEHLAKQCFDEPFRIGGEDVRMGCRIGAAVFPGDGDDAETLLRNAESALRRARASTAAFLFYEADMNAAANEALLLESRLRTALAEGQFVLHYQPKVRLDDCRICGVEALIRWQDPERGLVPPIRFIPVLEETGLIGAVGQWALRQALDDLRAWRAAGAAPLRVAVNVSPLQLNLDDFPEMVAGLIAATDGDALELEITESVIMDEVDRKVAMLSQVRSLGVSIAVDDFGTGYSSLSYIARLPITSLKIDRAFVNGMTAGPQGRVLVSSIVALAHALNLKVVAEGVETLAQADLLRQMGCDEGQGYLFSRPVPAAALLDLLLAGGPLPA